LLRKRRMFLKLRKEYTNNNFRKRIYEIKTS